MLHVQMCVLPMKVIVSREDVLPGLNLISTPASSVSVLDSPITMLSSARYGLSVWVRVRFDVIEAPSSVSQATWTVDCISMMNNSIF